jgi:hypothetical protein
VYGDFLVKKNGEWRLINSKGSYVLLPEYDLIKTESDGYPSLTPSS